MRRFDRRLHRGEEREHHPHAHARRDDARRQHDGLRRGADVERVDGAADEPEDAVRERVAEDDADRGAEEAEDETLGEERRKDLPRRRAQRLEDADVLPPPQDRDQHGVVNQEHPHQQRDAGQREEVHAERAQHLFHPLVAPRRPLQPRVRRNELADRRDERVIGQH